MFDATVAWSEAVLSTDGLTENAAETRHAIANARDGVPQSVDASMSEAYDELRTIAHQRLAALGRGRGGATLSTTALVHEAYLKLADRLGPELHDYAHFLATVSLAMRHVLVDRARERAAAKRGGGQRLVTFDDERPGVEAPEEILLQIDEALEDLAAWNPRLARVVDCRFFGGLSELETAAALGITVRTVQRDWVKARVLLRQALSD